LAKANYNQEEAMEKMEADSYRMDPTPSPKVSLKLSTF
jgi:hypothetical protein